MLVMSSLKRDAKSINKTLVAQKNGSYYTDSELEIIFPTHYEGGELMSFEERLYVVAILMIKKGNTYSVLSAGSIIELGKATIDEISVKAENGVVTKCFSLKYPRGAVVFESLDTIREVTFPYYVSNKLIKLGYSVPFFNSNDYETMFEKCALISGLRLPSYSFVNLFTSLTMRSVKDRTKPYRLSTGQFVNIPFKSVILNTPNTLSKFSGPYLNDSVQSALISHSDRASSLESVLRA